MNFIGKVDPIATSYIVLFFTNHHHTSLAFSPFIVINSMINWFQSINDDDLANKNNILLTLH